MLSNQSIEAVVPRRVERIGELVGRTPMVCMQRSGNGLVWVKLEGTSPAGSFHDRVAWHTLRAYPSGSDVKFVISGASNFAYSAAVLSRRRKLDVTVIVDRNDTQRLVRLLDRVGCTIVRAANATEASALQAKYVDDGHLLLRGDDTSAVKAAWQDLFAEVASTGLPLDRVVAFDTGLHDEALSEIASRQLGRPIEAVVLPTDHERERTLAGEICSRRTQTGHREGFLVSPLGAEVIDRAVSEALTDHRATLAIMPDAGNRYLGWW